MIDYEYSQEPYDCKEPFDDSKSLEILRHGLGRKKGLDASAYEEEPLQFPATGTHILDTFTLEFEQAFPGPTTSLDKADSHPLSVHFTPLPVALLTSTYPLASVLGMHFIMISRRTFIPIDLSSVRHSNLPKYNQKMARSLSLRQDLNPPVKNGL
jgi:hypothetical protein